MSISLSPSRALNFNGPHNRVVRRSLTVTNHDIRPIIFKILTTAPKAFVVRPNFCRVEPGESIEVSVTMKILQEEPPSNAKCKDKFLIQSLLISSEEESMALRDIWVAHASSKIHSQKLRVVLSNNEASLSVPSLRDGDSDADVSTLHGDLDWGDCVLGVRDDGESDLASEMTYVDEPIDPGDPVLGKPTHGKESGQPDGVRTTFGLADYLPIHLHPGHFLFFNRPLTRPVNTFLTITNPNTQPIAFKIKTTSPRAYCVRPNHGIVEPGAGFNVSVIMNALPKEPPPNTECKDKFLIQSLLISEGKCAFDNMWAAGMNSKIHDQRLHVRYSPPGNGHEHTSTPKHMCIVQ